MKTSRSADDAGSRSVIRVSGPGRPGPARGHDEVKRIIVKR